MNIAQLSMPVLRGTRKQLPSVSPAITHPWRWAPTLAVLAPEYDPVLVRTALHSVMQARTGGKNGARDSE